MRKQQEEFTPEEGRRLIEQEKQAKKDRAARLGDKAYDPKRDGPKVRFTRSAHSDPENIR